MRRAILVICDLLLGVTAVYGGLAVVPTLPAEWLDRSPFPDFTIPAIALTLVGATALAGAVGLIARPRLGAAVSFMTGGTIAVFELAEAAAINLGDWLALFGIAGGNRMTIDNQYVSVALTLQAIYLLLGSFTMALSWVIWRNGGAAPVVRAAPAGAAAPRTTTPPASPSAPPGRSRRAA